MGASRGCGPFVAALATVLLAASVPALARQAEIAGGASLSAASPSSSFTSSYTPPFPFVEHSGTASQRLSLKPGRGVGFWGAFTWFANPHVGFEARAQYRRASLGGLNEPHHVSLTYTARQPPDYVARQYSFDTSTDWPETEGRATVIAFTGALVARAGDPRRLQLRVSGGAGIAALSAVFQPVALTAYRLGGHSVLWADEYQLGIALARHWMFTGTGSMEVVRPVGPHAAVTGGVRLLVPWSVRAPTRVDRVLDTSGAITSITSADAQAALAPGPVTWRPWSVDLTVGLRLMF